MTQVKRFSEYAREIVCEYGDRAPGQHRSVGKYEDEDYQITIDSQSLVVRDKQQQKNILFMSNEVDTTHPELRAMANFTEKDFETFQQRDRQIDLKRQQEYQLSVSQSLSKQNQVELWFCLTESIASQPWF